MIEKIANYSIVFCPLTSSAIMDIFGHKIFRILLFK
jgi:hypothetical protein